MKITYTGRQVELAPAQRRKLEAQFGKLGKLLDGKQPREAHVVLSLERHLHKAEITVNHHDHKLVGVGEHGDLFHAIHEAVEHMEKQALKLLAKWREKKRVPRKEDLVAAGAGGPAKRVNGAVASRKAALKASKHPADTGGHVDKVNHVRKPMTLDEALLEIDSKEYLVYRDAGTNRISVLIKRRDGNLDLIEA